VKRAAYTRDAMGRVTNYTEYATDGVTVSYSRTSNYDNKSQLTSESTSGLRGITVTLYETAPR
jgi:hypothetical protein